MEKEDFFAMTNLNMCQVTGAGKQRFSEYKSGKPIGEDALTRYSEKMGITPGTLLDWIIEWRDQDVFDPNARYGRTYVEAQYENYFVGDDKRLKRVNGDPVMTREIFLGLSVPDMREMLKIPMSRLNTFIGGTKKDEKTIRRLADIFRITPGMFLDWFTEWKSKKVAEGYEDALVVRFK